MSLNGQSADTMWLMLCAFLVFFMQCGFALLEAGTVRAKNTKNILLKNLLDACVGAIVWWGWGFMVAYDAGDPFIGGTETTDMAPRFFLSAYDAGKGGEDDNGYQYAAWFFQYVFAAAAATIVSGAMAERTQLSGYIVYTTIITGFIYPVVVHWGWSSTGWFSAFNTLTADGKSAWEGGLVDFAGSGIVHMTGGVAALVGAAIVGPRMGRFDEAGTPLAMPGHSTTLQVMGTFMLWLGWYGFNPGSTLGLSPDNYTKIAARCVVTTTLSAAAGGITNLLLERFGPSMWCDHTWSVGAACNGILAGLVSITAGCSVLLPGSAVIAGVVGTSCFYFLASKLVLHVCKIDDPLDAFAVHGASGFFAVIFANTAAYPTYAYGAATKGTGTALAVALGTLMAEIGWVAGCSVIMFFPLKKLGLLRVSAEVETAGMDVSKHGGSAYETPAASVASA